MNDEMFAELLSSVREGGRIMRGEVAASRTTVLNAAATTTPMTTPTTTENTLDVRAIREQLALSRSLFANLIGVSERTIEGWEQGRRKPAGAARSLLYIAALHPEVVLESLFSSKK
jgi:putative transcriptional regulator